MSMKCRFSVAAAICLKSLFAAFACKIIDRFALHITAMSVPPFHTALIEAELLLSGSLFVLPSTCRAVCGNISAPE